jgi:hypothetical protein
VRMLFEIRRLDRRLIPDGSDVLEVPLTPPPAKPSDEPKG